MAPWSAVVVAVSATLGAGCSPSPAFRDGGVLTDVVDAGITLDAACLSGEGASTGPWLRCAGGTGIDRALAVATAADGDLYVGGVVGPSPRFGDQTATITEGFPQDAFVARYSREGALRWVRTFGSTQRSNQEHSESVVALAVDPNGGVYALGRLLADAHCGDGVVLGRAPPPLGQAEIYSYVARFGPDGRCQWAQRDVGQALRPGNLGVDAVGNVYLSGGAALRPDGTRLTLPNASAERGGVAVAVHPDGSATFATSSGGSTAAPGAVVHTGPDGAPRWRRVVRVLRVGAFVTMHLVAVGAGGTVLAHGVAPPGESLDFGDGVTLQTTQEQVGFAVVYDAAGTALRAYRVTGGGGAPDHSYSAFSPDGELVVGYFFRGALTLDADTTLRAARSTASEAFFARYGTDGRVRWVERMASDDPEDFIHVNVAGLAVDSFGDAIAVGYTTQGFAWRGMPVGRLGEAGHGLGTIFVAKAPGAR